MKRLALIWLMLLICSCDSNTTPPVDMTATSKVELKAPVVDRFTSVSIENAKSLLKAEPKVIDLIFDPLNVVEWHVAVKDDGSRRYGYAKYLCLLLREANAYDDDVDIRIVDAARISELKDAYRDYSLGAVQCKDGVELD
jgi:hypothetical protein